jgi:hypothetical protein
VSSHELALMMPMETLTSRQIAMIVIGMVAASFLTVGLTYLVLDRFVFASNDPLYKAGGIAPSQTK